VREYLDQVEAGSKVNGLYYLALGGALAIPDMCAALESTDGGTTGALYKAWFDTNVAPLYSGMLSGEDCYFSRCSFLHRGRTQHPRGSFSRIVFIEPGTNPNIFHMNVMNDALNIDVGRFCSEIVESARKWISRVEGSEPYESNLAKFVRRYPGGLAPYFIGAPVIS
jgi:hypothetical protein